MTSIPILSRMQLLKATRKLQEHVPPSWLSPKSFPLTYPEAALPPFVQASPVAMRYWRLLHVLDWEHFPERDLTCYRYIPPVPYRPFAAACLVKLEEDKAYMSRLHTYLVEHPALVWLLGFPLVPSARFPWGFDAEASLPTKRHLTRMLRTFPNAAAQWLLSNTVTLLQTELATVTSDFGQAISLDTKHILAWVKENNPKAYVSDRFDKTKQPTGDPDSKLGCKRKRNQRSSGEQRTASNEPATPLTNPRSPKGVAVGEYHWGYASGVIATKIPGWAEVVLAELTQPFDASDVSYFAPLMADTERRLGFRPRFGAFDAAFDAFYVYEHFHQDGKAWQDGFAAVPWAKRGPERTFDAAGLPLCDAGLAMPLKHAFVCRTAAVPHEKGRYVCPLLHPKSTTQEPECCPANHKRWDKGGCVTTLATGIGARLRHQIDRESDLYKQIYKQRTATERINSQAVSLGIERPHLRNEQAIVNQNTFIYVLLNLRALHRIRRKKARITS
jgi:hypothetical protein